MSDQAHHTPADSDAAPQPSVRAFSGSHAEWDEAVGSMDGVTYCHLHGWGDVFSEVFGHEPLRFVVHDEAAAIVGALPLVRMRSLLFGQNLLSMPFLNYGGPIGTPRARVALADHAIELGRDSGDRLVELRCRSPLDGTPHTEAPDKVTVLLDLPDDAEDLWTNGLKGKVRSQVRRPQKAGMTADFGAEYLSDFYSVFAQNMRDLGTPVLPRRLFEAIQAKFGSSVVVGVVKTGEGTVVSAGLGFLYRGEFELIWASSLRAYNRDSPNMLLYWSMMERVIQLGGRVFNFGRCTPGGGTHRFKLQWGGADLPLPWVRESNGSGAPPSKEGALYQKAISVWQRLPIPIANALGPRISRGLPTW